MMNPEMTQAHSINATTGARPPVGLVSGDLVGLRCRMSPLYIAQVSRGNDRLSRRHKRGTITGVSRDGWQVRVQWDDSKQRITYHRTCIEPIPPNTQISNAPTSAE